MLKKNEECIDDGEQITTTFLLSLKDKEAKLLMDKMIVKDKCIDYINHGHVSKCITIDELCQMTSSDHRNGKFVYVSVF